MGAYSGMAVDGSVQPPPKSSIAANEDEALFLLPLFPAAWCSAVAAKAFISVETALSAMYCYFTSYSSRCST